MASHAFVLPKVANSYDDELETLELEEIELELREVRLQRRLLQLRKQGIIRSQRPSSTQSGNTSPRNKIQSQISLEQLQQKLQHITKSTVTPQAVSNRDIARESRRAPSFNLANTAQRRPRDEPHSAGISESRGTSTLVSAEQILHDSTSNKTTPRASVEDLAKPIRQLNKEMAALKGNVPQRPYAATVDEEQDMYSPMTAVMSERPGMSKRSSMAMAMVKFEPANRSASTTFSERISRNPVYPKPIDLSHVTLALFQNAGELGTVSEDSYNFPVENYSHF